MVENGTRIISCNLEKLGLILILKTQKIFWQKVLA